MSLKRWNGSSWVTVAGSRPGPQGATGPTGAAATISVGTVTTVAAGQAAQITNGGSSSAAIFNFQIPQGPTGPAGTPGTQGLAGQRGTYTFVGINNPTPSNPTMLCSQLQENYPFINFMSIEYAPCKGDSEHIDGLRESRSIAQYRLKEINRNLQIWWQWKPEPGSYSVNDLINKALELRQTGKVNKLSKLAEYTSYSEYADMHTVWKEDYDIKRLVKNECKTDLFHYSAGANALIIRKDKGGIVNWAHSSDCYPLAIYGESNGFYHVFWMILDI